LRRRDGADCFAGRLCREAASTAAVSRAEGLWGKPTNINNVETWCNIAPIVTRGPAWFAETGSVKSPGTKVFSLVGKVQNTGLVEMPLGTPLKSFIYDIGEGAGRDAA
jgi:NADH-quinone oxidoreductase subunit F